MDEGEGSISASIAFREEDEETSWRDESCGEEKVISATGEKKAPTNYNYGGQIRTRIYSLNIVIFHNPSYITFISGSRDGESYSQLVSYQKT